jgi:NAD(P)H dehydrogenase (quinone)
MKREDAMMLAVTGASGNFGRLAAARLIERIAPHDLVLLSRTPEKLSEFAARGAACRRGDFDEPESLAPALAGAERMLLISATRVGKRIPQHRAAIEAAAAAGVKHIVYTSFVGVGPGNPALVARDHGATEEILKGSGLSYTLLRNAHYADAVADVIAPAAVETGKWISSAGEGRETVVWREDCVDCAVAVLTGEGHANRTYDITGPELMSMREMARATAEVSGKPIEYVPVDDEAMYAMFDAMGVPREPVDNLVVDNVPWNSDDMVSFSAAIRDGWLAVISDDVERLTGRKPRGLRELLEKRLGAQRM